MSRFFLICALAAVVIAFGVAAVPAAQVVGTASMEAPAVILQNNTGSLTLFSLAVTRGNGYVAINGPTSVGNSTFDSAQAAVLYASQYTGINYSGYNFTYTISDMNQSVSGPSAGAVMTILAVSALSHRPIRPAFTMTGTISSDGTIGQIGGVYDKVGAAVRGGMSFVLVPAVPAASQENELYYLVQQTYGVPLVQVANISDAAHYAFSNASVRNAGSYYDLYTDYNAAGLPLANLSCSNGCYSAPFPGLVNFTFSITRAETALTAAPGFSNVTQRLSAMTNESAAVAARGYLYAAADLGFLNFINAYFFANHDATVQSGLQEVQNTTGYCGSLSAPALNSNNYEWVLAGELRQAWGSYTASSTLSAYGANTSNLDTDEVLTFLYSNAQAQGWCDAANYMYGVAANASGTPVVASQQLATLASDRLSRASSYGPSLYYTTAQAALFNKNYPLAIVDADYAFAISSAGSEANLTTSQLDAVALSLAVNSTYGIWPTQFANEAEFYMAESRLASNATTAHSYAVQAYSSALLAQQLGNDTRNIAQGLVAGTPTTTVAQAAATTTIVSVPLGFGVGSLAVVTLIILVVVLLLDVVIIAMLYRLQKARRRRRKR